MAWILPRSGEALRRGRDRIRVAEQRRLYCPVAECLATAKPGELPKIPIHALEIMEWWHESQHTAWRIPIQFIKWGMFSWEVVTPSGPISSWQDPYAYVKFCLCLWMI